MDHREIAKELDLYHIEEHSPGFILWHPNGYIIYQEIEKYMRTIYKQTGFKEVKTPMLLSKELWEHSGHWDKYSENMFVTETEKREYALKPMNCPAHVLIFNSDVRSYRELPLRYGEFGICARNESSGSMHGIMRVRGFTQDDGHIFCTKDQIGDEIKSFVATAKKVYDHFGFTNVIYKISTRPAYKIGTDEEWDIAEKHLFDAVPDAIVEVGGGAFYGPKLELTLVDNAGRQWQCGTIQVDMQLPSRLNASYIDSNGESQTPIILHRAILGSFERFIGILLEHGDLPTWLAPVQAIVIPVSDKFIDYAKEVCGNLQIRFEMNLKSDTLSYKIQQATSKKIPYILVVGGRDEANKTVSIRKNNIQSNIKLTDLLNYEFD